MRLLRQCRVAAHIALLGLRARIGSALVVVISTACVVGVLLSMLAETEGLLQVYETGADPGRAIVMPADWGGDYGMILSRSQAAIILNAPGIATGTDGKPLADPEVRMWVPPNRGYLVDSPSLLGVGAAGLALRPGFRVTSGRLFQTGRRELLVGIRASRGFALKVGDQVTLPDGKWPIVGIFSASGSIVEGQLVGDAETIMAAAQIQAFGTVLVSLQSRDAFEPFRQWLQDNPQLGVAAERQSDYNLRTASRFTAFFTRIAYAVGVIMALGALFGSAMIMYAAVESRAREIAILQAIGYESLPLALSVLTETLLLALAGAALGAVIAWGVFSGRTIANFQTVFQTSITPGLLLLGLAWAAALAIMSGLFPAIRAARLAVSDALRAV
jgi:putative ABC transport system permease protein